jgi:hypothetical protein
MTGAYCSCGEKKYRRSDPKCEHCMAMDQPPPDDIIPLDHRARDLFWAGMLPDDYEAKPTDACFRCGNQLGTVVVPHVGWVCAPCEKQLSTPQEISDNIEDFFWRNDQ